MRIIFWAGWLLTGAPLLGQPFADSLLDVVLPRDSLQHIVYNPPVGILNDRPHTVDLIVAFDSSDIASVSLYARGDSAHTYRVWPMSGQYGRFSYVLPIAQLTGNTLTYFFLVTLRDYSLWAYPLGADGRIQPYRVDLVPPTLEFFQKLYYE